MDDAEHDVLAYVTFPRNIAQAARDHSTNPIEDFNPFAWLTQTEAEAGVSARAQGGFGPEETLGLPAPATTAIINGGTEVEYGARMRPGDVITSTTTLGEYKEREGRLGLMLFTITVDTWTNQRGETVKTSRGTLIRY